MVILACILNDLEVSRFRSANTEFFETYILTFRFFFYRGRGRIF